MTLILRIFDEGKFNAGRRIEIDNPNLTFREIMEKENWTDDYKPRKGRSIQIECIEE